MVARPSSPLGQGMRVTANGRTPDRAGKDSLIAPPIARVVLPCSVNERLRSDWGLDFLLTRNRQFKGRGLGSPMVGFWANAKGKLRRILVPSSSVLA